MELAIPAGFAPIDRAAFTALRAALSKSSEPELFTTVAPLREPSAAMLNETVTMPCLRINFARCG